MAEDSGNGSKQIKSKFQTVVDHLDRAHAEMGNAMQALSMIGFDLQKGADFIQRYRDSLIHTMQELGAAPSTPTLEEQMRDYLPKALRGERNEHEK